MATICEGIQNTLGSLLSDGFKVKSISDVNGLQGALDGKANTATTLAGYGITDAFTKPEVNTALGLKQDKSNKTNSWGNPVSNDKYPSEKLVKDSLDEKENTSNKVTSLSAQSTNTQYPTAKCTYDALAGKAASSHSHSTDEGWLVTIISDINTKLNKRLLSIELDDTVSVEHPLNIDEYLTSDKMSGAFHLYNGNADAKLISALLTSSSGKSIVILGAETNKKVEAGTGFYCTIFRRGNAYIAYYHERASLVTSVSAQSTNLEYPTAKCVYDELAEKADTATTLAGYGITDAYTKTQVDTALAGKAASVHTHEQSDVTGLTDALAGKADKVSSATNGNFAGLDSNGNLTDSGKKVSDFAISVESDDVVTSSNPLDLDIYLTENKMIGEFLLYNDTENDNQIKDLLKSTSGNNILFLGVSDTKQIGRGESFLLTIVKRYNAYVAYYHERASLVTSVSSQSTNMQYPSAKCVYDKLAEKAGTSDIPTKTSDLTNDSGFLTSHQDISGKADKVSSATNNNFAALDANGNLKDSGKKSSDFANSEHEHSSIENGGAGVLVQNSGDETSITMDADKVIGTAVVTSGQMTLANSNKLVTSGVVKTALDSKAEKVSNATNGNFAALDSNGNLTDSGKKAGDFALSGHTHSQIGAGNMEQGSSSLVSCSGSEATMEGFAGTLGHNEHVARIKAGATSSKATITLAADEVTGAAIVDESSGITSGSKKLPLAGAVYDLFNTISTALASKLSIVYTLHTIAINGTSATIIGGSLDNETSAVSKKIKVKYINAGELGEEFTSFADFDVTEHTSIGSNPTRIQTITIKTPTSIIIISRESDGIINPITWSSWSVKNVTLS